MRRGADDPCRSELSTPTAGLSTQVYKELKAAGQLEAKLDELYTWGNSYGWEPVVWKDGRPHPAPETGPFLH